MDKSIKSKKTKSTKGWNFYLAIKGICLIIIAFFAGEQLLLAPLSFGFYSSYLFIGGLVVLFASMVALAFDDDSNPKKATVTGVSGIILLIVILVGGCIYSAPLFHASSYENLLPIPQVKDFTKEISPFDVSKAPIVTKSTAVQVADKAISQDGTIGSYAEMKTITLQSVNGTLYWVTPLEYSGFFAWYNNKDTGTPYIMVNANTKECKLVKSNIKYQPSAFFGYDLARTLFNANPNYGYTDFTFEIDDSGHPYWTATTYKNTIGFSGEKAMGTAIVDAVTGKVAFYSVENTPAWVDHIQPADVVVNNINDRGQYINGFHPLNNDGKFKTTDSLGLVYNNGRCYYFTGITSLGKDQSSMGFYLVDTRTEATTYFKLSGAATEQAAINSAQGKLQQLGYTGSSSILMNVENNPTYFIPMQDKYGLTKQYAMVSVLDHTVLGTGDSIESCKEDYINALFQKNQLQSSGGNSQQITGTVTRIGQFVQQGLSYYTVVLDKSNMVYVVPVDQNAKLPVTKAGDNVTINYISNQSEKNSNTAVGFENNSMK